MTYFLPCVVFGQTASKMDGNCFLYALVLYIPLLNLIMATLLRGKIRQRQGIDGSAVTDCCASMFCAFCNLIQMSREVEDMEPVSAPIQRK